MRKSLFCTLLASTLLTCTTANAALLTATDAGLGNGSFTIEFNDANNNGLFDLNELTSFSGFLSVYGQNIVSVLHAPDIAGIANAGTLAGAALYGNPSWWDFEMAGAVDNSWDLAAAQINWTYAISDTSNVPEPTTIALLGLGLLGLVGTRRRSKAH